MKMVRRRGEQHATVLVRCESPGQVSWDVAAASEVVNEAIQEALRSIRSDYPDNSGTIPLEVSVTVDTHE